MTVKRWVALAIAAAVLGVSLIFNMFATIATADFEELFDGAAGNDTYVEEVEETGTDGNIVVLEIDGQLIDTGTDDVFGGAGYNHRETLDMLDNAVEDPTVDGIILEVDTPGGGLIESADIHKRIVEAQEDYGKDVYVSMGEMAASGGYYISAPADYIAAHPSTLTGSIGVIMPAFNFSELADNLGIEDNSITTGPYKDIMSMTSEMDDEEAEILQTIADEMLDEFVEVIVEGRDMSESTVRELADGRIFTGNQALDVGLVDGVGDLDQTIDTMADNMGLSDPTVIRYQSQQSFGSLWGMTLETLSGQQPGLADLRTMIEEGSSPRFMYLYQQ
ncbi:protease-4 [Geomicrobium halophilum]|uniref:Protease-4 n=1 Tax=Geomicrobium halophilum TaxID=549000 RepID=A0A841PHC4_9BACL|nr:signal peptide peptidase SppA [Geomicrobium halophilum]MBB6448149.1 protease-4 [Geomicrobium halophilum]